MIVNPNLPRVISNHPCISTIPVGDIIDYLQRHHLDAVIEAELEKLETEIHQHVEQRKKSLELERQAENVRGKSLLGERKVDKEKEKEKEKEKKDQNSKGGARNYRILKR